MISHLVFTLLLVFFGTVAFEIESWIERKKSRTDEVLIKDLPEIESGRGGIEREREGREKRREETRLFQPKDSVNRA